MKSILTLLIILALNTTIYSAIDFVPNELSPDKITASNLKENGGGGGLQFTEDTLKVIVNAVIDTCHVVREDTTDIYYRRFSDSISCTKTLKKGIRARGSIIKYDENIVEFEMKDSSHLCFKFKKSDIKSYMAWNEGKIKRTIISSIYGIVIIGGFIAMIYGVYSIVK